MGIRKMRTKDLVLVSMILAMQIVMTRFLSIRTPLVRIGFSFIAVALNAALYGPWVAGITGILADLIGMMLFPAGAYFPGFTLTAFLSGFIYGLFLYRDKIELKHVIAGTILVSLICNLGLNTLWLSMIQGKAWIVLLPPRVMKEVVLIIVKIITINLIIPRAVTEIRKRNY